MTLKIFLQYMAIGVVCIIAFLIFQKVTGIDIPAWIGAAIAGGLMSVITTITTKKKT